MILQSVLQLLMAAEHLLLEHQLEGETHSDHPEFQSKGKKREVYYDGFVKSSRNAHLYRTKYPPAQRYYGKLSVFDTR